MKNNSNKFLKLNSIRKKIILPVLLILLPCLILSFIGFEFWFKSQNRKNATIDLQNIKNQVEKDIKQIKNRALWIATAMSAIDGLDELYQMADENRARALLKQKAMPYYQAFLKNFHLKQLKIHYHKPPAKSFLRIWRKKGQKDGGDDISKFRNTVLAISKNHEVIQTIEIGRAGPVIRALAPIIRQGIYYGSVEAIFSFQELINYNQKGIQFVLFLKENQANIINPSVAGLKNKKALQYKIDDNAFILTTTEKIPEYIDKEDFSLVNGQIENYKTLFYTGYPVVDYSKQTIGTLFLIQDRQKEISDNERIKFIFILILLLIGFIASAITFIIGTRMQTSLKQVEDSMQDIASGDGDLTMTLKISSDDEIGKLGNHFNFFIRKIRNVIRETIHLTGNVNKNSSSIKNSLLECSSNSQSEVNSLKDINRSIQEVSQGSETVYESTNQQVEELLHLDVLIAHLTENLKNSNQSIQKSFQSTSEMEKQARKGEQALELVSRRMQRFQESSKQMMKIINIINKISKSINLLSLNASIESERAGGDVGKGFGVVAGEITKLATDTSRSINEINNLIYTNEEEIIQGVQEVDSIIKIINSIIGYVKDVNRRMEVISIDISTQEQSSQKLQKKLSHTREQSQILNHTTKNYLVAVERIKKEIQTISLLTHETANNVTIMTENAEELHSASDNLTQKISFFKV